MLINDKNYFYTDNKWCAQRFIEFTDEKLKPKVKNWGWVYLYHELIGETDK